MKYHAASFAAALAALLSFAPPVEAQTLAVFTKSQNNPVARAIRVGTDTAAKTFGLKVFHFIPTTPDDVEQQTGLVEGVIASKPDAVVFTPVDPKAMVPAVGKLNAAGIPVINVSDRLAGGDVVAFVGSDDYAVALATARTLLKAMDGKGNVVVLEGAATAPSNAPRMKGFNDALKEFPQVKLLASKPASYARRQAVDVMNTLIRQFPQIDGVLAANDPMALGAIDALKAANKKALIVGINAGKEAIDLIKSGELLASGEYNGFIEGCLAAEIAMRAVRKQPTPKQAMVKSVVVDKTNYQPYEIPVERRPCPTLDSVAAN